MDYPLVSFSQPGGDFYACGIRADKIVHRLEVHRRSERASGIQRDENVKRVRSLTTYLESESAILPTPVIVSVYDDKVQVHQSHISLQEGDDMVGHVLDGQHRILGLKDLPPQRLEEFELLVIFVFGVDDYAQATIFSTINSNQRQVSKSLIYDLFGLSDTRSKERTGHEICRSLSEDPDSPFYRKIKLLGKKVEDTETLSQAAFVDELLRVMKVPHNAFLDFYNNEEDWAIRKVMANLFGAIKSEQARFGNQVPHDFFFKTTGYGGVMRVLPKLLNLGKSKGSLGEEFFSPIFAHLFQSGFRPPVGAGRSIMTLVANEIEKVLSSEDARSHTSDRLA